MDTLSIQPAKFAYSRGFSLFEALSGIEHVHLPTTPSSVGGTPHQPHRGIASRRLDKKKKGNAIPEPEQTDSTTSFIGIESTTTQSPTGPSLDDEIVLEGSQSGQLYAKVPPSTLDQILDSGPSNTTSTVTTLLPTITPVPAGRARRTKK